MMSNREKLFEKMMLPEEPIAETANPKMEAYTSLRNRLLPNLLEVLYNNKHHPYPQNLFEIDDVIRLESTASVGAKTKRHLSVVLCHSKANFSEIKAVMDNVFDVLGVRPEVEEKSLNCFIEGRCCTGIMNSKALCWAGEIKPEVIVNWELELPIVALEIDVSFLHSLIQESN